MAAPSPLVLLGAGGNGLDVLDIVEALNAEAPRWRLAGILDDAAPAGGAWRDLPILGRVAEARRLAGPDGPLAGAMFLNAIGSERTHAARPEIVARTGLPAARFATLVHPRAGVSPRAALGHGVCIGHGVSIAGQVRIDDHAWIGPGCVIGHDSVVEACALMAPRATISGFVRLGAASYLGSAAVVRQRVRIGAGALVGLGAVVLADVDPGTVVVGNPARLLVRGTAARLAE
jgi:sugar O-acyltransferase (sialic acid O-acetyltransferase NeuD family)